MKSFVSCFQSYFPLIAILAASSCAIGCSTVLGTAFAIGDAVKTSKAKDAMVAKKQSEEADIKSAMDLYNFPTVFKRHQFSSELYWCYPKELTENNRPSQECELDKCCEHITIEEAPYIVFNGNRISLETEESFIRRFRIMTIFTLTVKAMIRTAMSLLICKTNNFYQIKSPAKGDFFITYFV